MKNEIYRGHELKPRVDKTWPAEDSGGFWVVKDGCNIMPGATWFHTKADARKGINRLLLANGDANLFWLLMGHAGLNSYGSLTGPVTIRCSAARQAEVVADKLAVKLTIGKGLSVDLTPQQALAISCMLREAAEHALGETV